MAESGLLPASPGHDDLIDAAASILDLSLRLRTLAWCVDGRGLSDAHALLGEASDQSMEHFDAVLGALAALGLVSCLTLAALHNRSWLADMPPHAGIAVRLGALEQAADGLADRLRHLSVSLARQPVIADLLAELQAEIRMQAGALRASHALFPRH